jgi:hypothetical protein
MAEQHSATTPILGLAEAMPTIAVRKIDTARRFYEDVLDLEVVHHDSESATYKSGRSTILVYESQFAGTNEATAMTWVVGKELDQIVAALKASASSSSTTTCRTRRAKATSMFPATSASPGSRIRTATSSPCRRTSEASLANSSCQRNALAVTL